MSAEFDRSKSLQELEKDDWGEPTYDSSLVASMYRLRRKPLNEYTVEDLRIMIGQQTGLSYLIPIAIERLAENPLVSGDYYKGDLLKMVLCIDEIFWKVHQDLWWAVQEIVVELEMMKETLEKEIRPAADKFHQAKETF